MISKYSFGLLWIPFSLHRSFLQFSAFAQVLLCMLSRAKGLVDVFCEGYCLLYKPQYDNCLLDNCLPLFFVNTSSQILFSQKFISAICLEDSISSGNILSYQFRTKTKPEF